ncbi:deoxyribodipyrimidine photo-lyase [uncultured Microbacterium sp.]|uniref:cryptochrome/photolyase family protein n=1 Tax=uncultured Microbacterium sp. TaxID=191216 RepID=UPI002623FE6D|nr:deoxyribodipyrimidine photo-lyase [uncultured Microbacterium sp.]
MTAPVLVWFRDDLRIADHPALHTAAATGAPIIGIYVLDEESAGVRALGGAARWWLHHSLTSLGERLAERGVRLVLRRGPAVRLIRELVTETGARGIHWNRRYGKPERDIDAELKSGLRDEGVDAHSHAGNLLHEPWTVQTGAGTHYSVFTPFWRACQALPAPRLPLPEPPRMTPAAVDIASDALTDWELLPTAPDWAAGLRTAWTPGEPAAVARLHEFLEDDLSDYDRARDEPASGATSMISPRLRWGEISPHTAWHAAVEVGGSARFLAELGWREFAWHTLFHFPALADDNLRPEFDAFPWPPLDPDMLVSWQRGETGIPLVDAGMRELWETGHMHNRVRMVTASFLIKNLLIDWRIGEEWFWDTLVDADAASNPFNWQWVAGSGADAAPYFRVFNPILQAEKFDPHGEYIRRWGGATSREPIVDLRATRQAALNAYEAVKSSQRPAR